ncbi:MAG: hypothetical protein K2M91_07005, partial [Lachnospiraceae bacterium]|nr:hypothetical protein [Lachnospiraceae bacterium]
MNDKELIARRVLEACRNQLFFENRFLEQALFRLKWKDDDTIYFGSEGSILYYSADYILERYMQSPQQLMTDYLHTVLHCLFQHPFFVPQEQKEYWDLASDIAVECILEEIIAQDDTKQGRLRRRIVERVKRKIGMMSAQKIFGFLLRDIVLDKDSLDFFGIHFDELCSLFKRDEHSLWYAQKSRGEAKTEKDRGEQKTEDVVMANDKPQFGVNKISAGTSEQNILQNQKQLQQLWK